MTYALQVLLLALLTEAVLAGALALVYLTRKVVRVMRADRREVIPVESIQDILGAP